MKKRAVLFTLFFLIFLIAFVNAATAESISAVNREIIFTTNECTLYIGKKITVKATVNRLDESAPRKTSLVWSTSDESVATVVNGTVTGKSAGKAVITASAKDDENITQTLSVEVLIPVSTVTVSEKKVQLLVGAASSLARYQLEADISPENASTKRVRWSSSDESVVCVDETGLMTAVSAGKAKITCISDDPTYTKKQPALSAFYRPLPQ